ncbi:MAG TPA: glycosyltransferase family 1 protein [Rhodocyclaceae bacterium]|nr:MAG: glycosyltransferase family 1 protein [Rhodocyclales bacterium CG17_big_fil_post_rev_8_21_14_2_50_68_7]PJA56753.1 MAG: glycosyltransferase family 1 protein [Rhodocyclales bacterium CG_4_9_14_3_um_filter_68_10]HCX34919.1 glycosyltransferase family 1 protein [Rhodocyclaceae bacterium]
MRIAIIRQRYTPFGGAERFVERALAALQVDDLDVTVIARDWPEDEASAYRRQLVRPFAIGRAWRDAAFARAACAAVKAGGFDLVQSHERLSCCDIYRAGDGVHREWLHQRGRRRGALARFGDRLSLFHRRVLAAEKAMYASQRLKAVVCNSRMVRDEIVRHYGLDETRVHVIRNGVDMTRFHPRLREEYRPSLRRSLGVAEAQPLFLCVGSGFERKGVDLLLDLWPDLPASAVLVVVGNDHRLNDYRRRAARCGTRVRIVGPQQDVRPWLGSADAFLLPTLYDPFPNAALEALACGLPVLTSSKSGVAELIEAGVNGEVRDALDTGGWREIVSAWADTERCAAASDGARKAAAPLTLDAMQSRFRELYSGLLQRP